LLSILATVSLTSACHPFIHNVIGAGNKLKPRKLGNFYDLLM
jgi:hypothetical protein